MLDAINNYIKGKPMKLKQLIKLLTFNPQAMDQSEIQKKVETFLKELGVPSFIVFGWQKNPNSNSGDKKKAEFGIVSSYNKIPPQAAIKGMSWALNDFINKSLK